MAESALKPLGDPGKGIHSALCRCSHDRCNSWKDGLWCCHWFFAYWTSSRPVMPSEVFKVLRDRLGTTEFDYLVNPTSTGPLWILVYVKDFTVLDGQQFDLVPYSDNPHFVHKDCRFWRLPCCQKALVADSNYWNSCLMEEGGRPGFGKNGQGSGTLYYYFTKQVQDTLLLQNTRR